MSTLYGILDAAQNSRVFELVRRTPNHACLYAGELAAEVERGAPYLVNLDTSADLVRAWEVEGRQKNWGIQCYSEHSLSAVRRHFRHFLRAKLPDGSTALFRFYDPRIWRVYLPTCNERELRLWFGMVDEFSAEDEQGGHLVYFEVGGRLSTKRRPVKLS